MKRPPRPYRVRLGRRLVRLSRPEAERIAGILRFVVPVGEVTVHIRGRRHTMKASQAVRARRVLALVLDLGGLP